MRAIATGDPLARDLALIAAGRYIVPCCWVDEEGRCAAEEHTNCDDPGRTPLTRNGWAAAVVDPHVVQNWRRMWPKANTMLAPEKEVGPVKRPPAAPRSLRLVIPPAPPSRVDPDPPLTSEDQALLDRMAKMLLGERERMPPPSEPPPPGPRIAEDDDDDDEQDEEEGSSSRRNAADVLRAAPDLAPRFQTGFKTLDRKLRGGLRAGDFFAVVGGPGAGKSVLVQQVGTRFARSADSPVLALHKDEGDQRASVRQGQILGLERELLEARDPATLDSLVSRLVGVDYAMLDVNDWTLERAMAKAQSEGVCHGGPPVVLADSINTVLCEAAAEKTSEADQIEAKVGVIRDAVHDETRPVLVLATCEAVKISYSDPTREISPLAAPANGRSIAHAADVLLELRPDRDDDTFFEVIIGKNRIGGELGRFFLRLDRTTATFREIDAEEIAQAAAEAREAGKKAKASTAADRAATALREALKGKADGSRWSKKKLAEVSSISRNGEKLPNAIAVLVGERRLIPDGEGWILAAPEAEPPASR